VRLGTGIATLLCVALLLGSAIEAGATHPHDRNGFFIGFGLGGGNGEMIVGDDSSDREEGGTANFRLGWAVSPRVTLGLEAATFARTEEVLGEEVTFIFSAATFGVTVYPTDSGFYLHGGGGFGGTDIEVDVAGVKVSYEESGFSLLGAIGYEWRLTPKFALGPKMEYVYLGIDGDIVDSANFISLAAQLSWYW